MKRFWEKVKIGEPEECWEWQGCINANGYGNFRLPVEKKGEDSRVVTSSRFAWNLTYGEIPKEKTFHGICVLHKCDNRKCVNPNHLFLGTHKDNMKDRCSKGRTAITLVRKGNTLKAKLTPERVIEIRDRYKNGESQRKLAKEFGVIQQTLSCLILNKSWKHVC